jgi:hypothetical protein
VRNREKQDLFYIQDWRKNNFFFDFIAFTKKGNIIAIEWKGEDGVRNEDTEYKVFVGEICAKLGKSKLLFFLVHNGNMEEILIRLKEL